MVLLWCSGWLLGHFGSLLGCCQEFWLLVHCYVVANVFNIVFQGILCGCSGLARPLLECCQRGVSKWLLGDCQGVQGCYQRIVRSLLKCSRWFLGHCQVVAQVLLSWYQSDVVGCQAVVGGCQGMVSWVLQGCCKSNVDCCYGVPRWLLGCCQRVLYSC